MFDQANDLRELVRKCAVPRISATPRPRRIVVFGGKGGVGTTTLAVNLAVELSRQGVRTVLVDAAGGDAAILCGVEPKYTVADALSGEQSVARTLQPAPGGLSILPGTRQLGRMSEDVLAAWDRFLAQLGELGSLSDLIVVDAGCRPDRIARRLWQTADRLLLVTTPETAAIMDTYASIKVLAEPGQTPPMHLLVNAAPSLDVADEVYRRLAQACRRFQGIALINAGDVPTDRDVACGVAIGNPLVLAVPGGEASCRIRHVAQTLMSMVASRLPDAA